MSETEVGWVQRLELQGQRVAWWGQGVYGGGGGTKRTKESLSQHVSGVGWSRFPVGSILIGIPYPTHVLSHIQVK